MQNPLAMRFLPTTFHAAFDYGLALVLITMPAWLILPEGAATNIPASLGTLLLGGSLLTKYEYGVLRLVPLRIHLLLDVVCGAFLAVSPWLFGFVEQYPPFLLFGIVWIAAALVTHKHAGLHYERPSAAPHQTPRVRPEHP